MLKMDSRKDRIFELGEPYWRFERSHPSWSPWSGRYIVIPDRWVFIWPGLAPNGLVIQKHGATKEEALRDMKKTIRGLREDCSGKLARTYKDILDNWNIYESI